jgi:fructokinase
MTGATGEPRTVVAIGEALWDVFPDGRRPGGAPCNVAYHAARLGDRGVIVTRVGADALGTELREFLADRGVDTDWIQRDPTRPTGTVTVTTVGGEPLYSITESVAWDRLDATPEAIGLVAGADALCLGTLGQRDPHARAATERLAAAARGRGLVMLDVNLRRPFVDRGVVEGSLRWAEVVKLNLAEVAELSRLLERAHIVEWLVHELGTRAVYVTRGAAGASLVTARGVVEEPGVAVDTSHGDAVGAGDAFTAALIHHLIRGAAPEDALGAANAYAALIASKRGAMPPLTAAELAAATRSAR